MEKLRCLIIDDSPFTRINIRLMLEQKGHTIVAEAENGKDGAALYRRYQPEIVTLDMMMPNGDGPSAMEQIHQFDPIARIIIVSAVAPHRVKAQCRHIGPFEFVPKPVQSDPLYRAIGRLMMNREIEALDSHELLRRDLPSPAEPLVPVRKASLAGVLNAGVLIVDDELASREELRLYLASHGFTVSGEAETGDDAVSLYKTLRPDIVTLDLILRGENGFSVLRRIKDINPSARVIVVSSLNDRESVEKAIALGANAYVTKSSDWSSLHAALSVVALDCIAV